MSKGKASQNSLKALAYPIQQFIAAWGTQTRPSKAEGTALPAPYQLAALRGEGILRQRFFNDFMHKLPVQLEPAQQITLWQELVEDGGYLITWVQRLGIASALRREAVLPTQHPSHAVQENRTLYCLLLDALAQQAPDKLPWAVEGYFWHVWKERFPDSQAIPTQNKTTQADTLRDQLTRALRKQFGKAVEVKESFQQAEHTTHFSLRYKLPSQAWQTLIELERPRLKTARLAAYEAALKDIALKDMATQKMS